MPKLQVALANNPSPSILPSLPKFLKIILLLLPHPFSFSPTRSGELKLSPLKNSKLTLLTLQWCAIEIIQQVFIKKFQLFWQPSQRSSETNDTSFESPNNKLLESGKILGVASFWGWLRPLNWKSTTFTKTRVEPVMIEILPVSRLISNDG